MLVARDRRVAVANTESRNVLASCAAGLRDRLSNLDRRLNY